MNNKGACEQARTLFELTATKFHFQIANQVVQITGAIPNDVLWERLTDVAKEGVDGGLGDTMLVEVVESGGYHTMNLSNYILIEWIVSSSPAHSSFRV